MYKKYNSVEEAHQDMEDLGYVIMNKFKDKEQMLEYFETYEESIEGDIE